MPNIKISDLEPIALPAVGADTFFEVQTVAAGEDVSRKMSLDDVISTTGLDASFLTVSANAQLPNERVLTEGTGITFVDSGPNGTLTINAAVGGDVFKVGTPVDNEIGVWTGDGTIEGDPNFTWDGSQFLLPLANTPAAPTLAFGDGDSGFFQPLDDNLQLSLVGVSRFFWELDSYNAVAGTGPSMKNLATSSTVPGFVPRRSDPNTGIGSSGLDALSLIAGGVEIARAFEATTLQFAVAPSGNSSVPELAGLTDLDTGFRWPADNTTVWIGGGSRAWNFSTVKFFSEFSNGPGLFNRVAQNDVVTVAPDHMDDDTGIGGNGSDELSLIAGGVEGVRVDETGGSITVTCFGSLLVPFGTAGQASVGFDGDPDTGYFRPVDDAIAITAGGVEGTRWAEAGGSIIKTDQNDVAIVASTTQTQGQQPLLSSYNEITSVANPNDVVTAPSVSAGMRLTIINNGGNPLQVFPAAGDNIGGGVDGSITIATGAIGIFLGRTGTDWDTLYNDVPSPSSTATVPDPLLLSSGGVGVPTYSFAADSDTGVYNPALDSLGLTAGGVLGFSITESGSHVVQTNEEHVGLTASVTQTQVGGLALLSSYNEIATVANAGDALTAFAVAVGQRLVVINNGAEELQLFPASGDSFGSGVDTAIVIGVGNVGVFLGRDSTNWDTLFNGNPNNNATGGATIQGTWRFDSSTVEADPGAGDFRLDNATVGLTTEIFISSTTRLGFDADNILGLLADGDQIYIQNINDSAEFLLFDITANVDNGGWYSLAGTVNISGSNFTNNRDCGVVLLFSGAGAGGTLPAGTIGDSSLKWDGVSAWVEETQVAFPGGATGIKVFDGTLGDFITMGHNGSTAGFSVNGATTEVIFGQGGGPTTAWRFSQMVRVPDGSAAVPGITWFGDIATGIYRHALGLSVSITGVEQLRVSNATTQVLSDDLRLDPDLSGSDFVRFIVDGVSNPNDFEIETTGLTDIHIEGVGGERFVLEQFNLAMEEKAAAPADVAGVGQFWVRDDAPNTAMFTTDTGVDKQLINDVVQARRTTGYVLTTAFVDVTLDATDVETDSAVLDHDLATNSDNIIAGVAGTYKVSYQFNITNASVVNTMIEAQARVRLNDAGTGIPGSLASEFNQRQHGEQFTTRMCCDFVVTLAATDFITLQAQKIEIDDSQTYTISEVSVKAMRLL